MTRVCKKSCLQYNVLQPLVQIQVLVSQGGPRAPWFSTIRSRTGVIFSPALVVIKSYKTAMTRSCRKPAFNIMSHILQSKYRYQYHMGSLCTIVFHYSSQNRSHFFRSISSCLELQNDIKTSRKKDCPPNKSLRILFTNPNSMTFYHFFNTFLMKKVIILVLNNTIFEISSQNWVYLYDFHCFLSTFIFLEKFTRTLKTKKGLYETFEVSQYFTISLEYRTDLRNFQKVS